jgi:penicillin-binding protein 2
MLRFKRRNPPPEDDDELERPRPIRFVRVFALLIVLAFIVLVYQLYQIQIVQYDYYRVAADTNRFRIVSTAAPRGVMYDQNGKLLVYNEPSFKVSIVPVDLPPDSQDDVLKKLAALIDAPLDTTLEADSPDALGSLASDVSRSFISPTRKPGLRELVNYGRDSDPYSPVLVKTDIPRSIAFVLQEKALDFPGVRVGIDPVRNYPEGELTSQILGYMGHIPREEFDSYKAQGYEQTDQVGLSGLELIYEDQLRGQSGQQHVEVDANGNIVRVQAEEPARPGNNLYLTIDVDFQRKVEAALKKGMIAGKAKQGVAIVEDPNNGEILAMVSLPSYDDNLFANGIKLTDYQALSQDPLRPLVDQAISGQYPPGSTFKLVAASGALQEGVIDDKMTLFDPGVIYLPNKYFPNDPRLAQPFYNWFRQGFGALPLREAIAQSCDTCFYKLVGGYTDFPTPLGQTLESEYARLFGYGSPLGIDLPGEAPGVVPDPAWKKKTRNEAWVTGDTYNMAIGQGDVLATPLQVLNMTAVVANGGYVFRPHLVRGIVNADGTMTNTVTAQVVRHLPIDPRYFQLVRDGMRGAVTHGTAWKANLEQIDVAAKTGTAEYYGPRVNGYLPTHAWFTAFAPFDKPQIAVVVLVVGGGQGSEIAAPVVTNIIRAYFNLPPDAPLAQPLAPPPPPETQAAKPSSPGPAAAPPHKFAGHLVQVQDNGNSERPIFYGAVLDTLGRGVPGVSLTLDIGDGNAIMRTTTGDGGEFRFADIDFHVSSHWVLRLTAPGDAAPLNIDVAPYKQYQIVFNATGQ